MQRFPAHNGTVLRAVAIAVGTLSSVMSAQPQTRPVTASDALGVTARQAMIDIFRKKDATGVDRYFDGSFVQHDPNFADGLAGIRSFAAEVASSPSADITIYRTLVDGSFVCCIPGMRASDVTAARLLLSTCSVSATARSLSIGADRSRRSPPISQAARRSMVQLKLLIAKRQKPIGHWCGRIETLSWSHCALIGSTRLLTTRTTRSTPRK
jgi:hypothetical protein